MSGSIHKRGDLKEPWFYVRWYWDRQYYTISWYQGRRMYAHKEAQKLLSQMQGDVERGVFNIQKYLKGQSQVVTFLHEWMEECASNWQPSTIKAYQTYLKRYLDPFFQAHNITIQEIRLNVLNKLKLALTEQGLHPQYQYSIINGCIKSCLRYAKRSGLIEHMPEFPTRAEFGVKKPRPRYVSMETQAAIIEAIEPEHRAIFLWLALHMRRPSEAIALRKEDYNPTAGVFVLSHGISGSREVERIKTGDDAEIPCHGAFKKILEGMTFPFPFSPFMFTCRSSRHPQKRYSKDILNKAWNDACAKVGVTISLYQGTKHSSAQSYLDSGYSFEQVMLVTGHKSMSSVKHYAHAEIEHRRSLMERRVVPLRARKVEEG